MNRMWDSLTPCSPNNATIESLSCTIIINILAVAEALSDTCFNLIIVFLSLICDCLLGRGGERGQLGEGGERGWLLLWWESVSVCTIQQPGSNELKSCSVARNVRVSSLSCNAQPPVCGIINKFDCVLLNALVKNEVAVPHSGGTFEALNPNTSGK